MKKAESTNNQRNDWADAVPALVILLLHVICCIGVALFVLLGGVGMSAMLASRGFWAIAIGGLAVSIAGYLFFRHKNSSSSTTSHSGKGNKSTEIQSNRK
ncbi:hypothetical protein NC796_05050 [Aliifodinibius sp. S!AR15-10]|uniref:hypothetical protein n=1 Tax=Aliifodinibius sp. S!AR15-10 TaxID=2950437 RepID=UPI002861D44E|nr:hypothetical protein [Aliifodinibius sp. S!AR15-10]MDR8390499.1 hypothetical protein [Aliifodinibius sp. S!AR15-10]